jgi:glycosyltransferase involved in cell wall biosynthesis
MASVLGQTHRDLELIVIDDGSTDGTADRATSFADERTRILRFANGGVAVARNRGLEAATGSLVALLDQDDTWYPAKLERQVAVFQALPDVVAVGAQLQPVDGTGRPIRGPVMGWEAASPATQEHIRRGGMPAPCLPSSLVFRTAALRQLGGFDPDVAPVDDIDLYARLVEIGRMVVVGEALGTYRMHGAAQTHRAYRELLLMHRFVQARLAARRAGSDLTLAEFRARDRLTVRERRHLRAACWYKRGGLRATERRFLAAAGYIALATVTAPSHALPRLRSRLAPPAHAGPVDPPDRLGDVVGGTEVVDRLAAPREVARVVDDDVAADRQ